MTSLLKIKAVKGFSWYLIERVSLIEILVVTGIILARLLSPDEFGLISMITVFFAIAQVFIDRVLFNEILSLKKILLK